MNIFFIETPTGAVAHGVGTYANNLLPKLSEFKDLHLYYLKVRFSNDRGDVIKTRIADNFTVIEIKFENADLLKREEVVMPLITVRAIFCIISECLQNVNQNIFHLNSLLQKSFVDVAKEYEYKVVFVQHVSLWRIFYNNNMKKFLIDWRKNSLEARESKFIKSIALERDICRQSDSVICLSEENLLFAKQYYELPREKLVLIKNGVACRKLKTVESLRSIKKTLGFRDSDFIFLFVGRLIEQKGLGLLINAFKILAEKKSSVKLLIVGGGTEMEKYVKLSASLCGRIAFTGYVTGDKVDDYYGIADVGVMPSTTEQSSFVVLEMLSKKLPAILSDIQAFNEFNDGQHVLKVKTDDNGYVYVELLYKTMKKLYESALCRKEIAENGYQLFLNHYNANIMAQNTYAEYCRIYM